MSNSIVRAALIVGLGLSLQSHAADDTYVSDNQWYFSPHIGMNFEDTDRASNPGVTLDLALGKRLSSAWTMELSVFGGLHDGFNQMAMLGVGIDMLRTFGSADTLSPYLLLGTGWMRTDFVEDPALNRELEYNEPIGSLGVGVMGPLGSFGNRFRGEVRYRADDKFSDLLVSIGLFRPFGNAALAMSADEDNDSVADDIDNCPATPDGVQVDRYGCDADAVAVANEASDIDSDGDGVPDRSDICSGTAPAVSVGDNGCEHDGDRDWVVDSLDMCPNSRKGARTDSNGCEVGDKIELSGVLFELESATLIARTTAMLDQAADTLRRNSALRVEAAGYTDTTGSPSHNLNLSQRRAESVRRYLISKGANGANITAKGYGQANPLHDNSTRYGRMGNRRVDLRILN